MSETQLNIRLFHKLVDEAAQLGIPCRELILWLNPAMSPAERVAYAKPAAAALMELMAKKGKYEEFMAASPRARATLLAKLLLPSPASGTEQKREKQHRGMSVKLANAKAIKLAKEDPNFVKQGAREWASAIGCSVSTVHKTHFWRGTMRQSGRGRSRGPCAKTVSLTQRLETSVGEGDRDAVLEELIAQQEADYEPGPLDSATARKAHRINKRL